MWLKPQLATITPDNRSGNIQTKTCSVRGVLEGLEQPFWNSNSGTTVLKPDQGLAILRRNRDIELTNRRFLHGAVTILGEIQQRLQQTVRVSQYQRQLLRDKPSDDAVNSQPVRLNDDAQIVQHPPQRDLLQIPGFARTGMQLQICKLLKAFHQIGESLEILVLREAGCVFQLFST